MNKHYSKTKILITGGSGFIGSSLADQLIANPDNYVVIVDNLLTGEVSKLPDAAYDNWTFVQCDVNNYADISAVMLSHSFDYVFHYAALVGVRRTLNHPLLVLEDIEGIKHILQLSKNTGVKRVFYSSSSEVYGESISYPQDEISTPLNSRLPYAVVKNLGEAYFTSYKKKYNLDYTIFRFFNTYGPKQSDDFVMSRFIKAALRNNDITVYGTGDQTRTFCYISDNIAACLAIFNQNKFLNDVVNIGSDVETSILTLAKKIVTITGSSSKIIHCPARKEGDMHRRLPNNSRMKTLLSHPLITLEKGIEKLIASGKFQ